MTPLQMAVMTSAVANGVLMQPRLILRVNSPHALGQRRTGYSKQGGGRPQSQAADHLAIT